jgi:soluble P-type ATPase
MTIHNKERLILDLSKQKIRILIANKNNDVNILIAATFVLKGYENPIALMSV